MPRCEVINEFNCSPDGRETVRYALGSYEVVEEKPGPGQITALCAMYGARKGYALQEGTTDPFQVPGSSEAAPGGPLAPSAAPAKAPVKVKRSRADK